MRLPRPFSDMHGGLRVGVLSFAIFAGFCVQANQAETAQMRASEIEAELVGQQLILRSVEGNAVAQLLPNGVATAKGADWSAMGHWIVFDDRLCFYLADDAQLANDCVAIERLTDSFFWGDNGTLVERTGTD